MTVDNAGSSSEEIDLDNEIESDLDEFEEEKIINRIHPRRQMKEPVYFSTAVAMKQDDNPFRFKVVGYNDVSLTCKPKSVTDSWIASSTQFSAQITTRETLSKIDNIEGISPKLVERLRKFTDVLFPVQEAVIPALINCRRTLPRDFVITAPTGSGKTLCFVIPVLNALERVQKTTSSVFALVVAPVQNLAQQIYAEFLKYNVNDAKIVLLSGVQDYDTERSMLFPLDDDLSVCSKVHVIVATPARLVEHLMDNQRQINLTQLQFLIVDEADRLNDTARMEWLGIVERRALASPVNSLTITELMQPTSNRFLRKILCSATLSLDLNHLHIWNLRCPRLFKAQSSGNEKTSEINEMESKNNGKMVSNVGDLILPANLSHRVIMCQTSMKPAFLYLTLATEKAWNKILVFVNQKTDVHKLTHLLSALARSNFKVAEFSSDMYGNRRAQCLKQFQEGKIRVLVSTDVLSRGIDVSDVDCVINYQPPINERIFVHRAGRTARGLSTGTVISIVDKEEKMRMKKMLTGMNAWESDILQDKRKTEDFINPSLLRKYTKTIEYLRSQKEKEQ